MPKQRTLIMDDEEFNTIKNIGPSFSASIRRLARTLKNPDRLNIVKAWMREDDLQKLKQNLSPELFFLLTGDEK